MSMSILKSLFILETIITRQHCVVCDRQLHNLGEELLWHSPFLSHFNKYLGWGIEFEEKRDGRVLFLHLDHGVIGKWTKVDDVISCNEGYGEGKKRTETETSSLVLSHWISWDNSAWNWLSIFPYIVFSVLIKITMLRFPDNCSIRISLLICLKNQVLGLQ